MLRRAFRRPARLLLDRIDERHLLAERSSPALKAGLRSLYLEYRRRVAAGEPLPTFPESGVRVFSQYDEDGIVLLLLGAAGIQGGRFLDIGAGDGVTASNCANLAINLGFDGVMIEADPARSAVGRHFYASHPDTRERPPAWIESFVTRESIDGLVSGAGLTGDIDVLSIDIDGNDWWIWDALTCVSPRFVVVEVHPEHGSADVISPYEAAFDWRTSSSLVGASPAAMTRLAAGKGYRLVAVNRFGFNAFYARSDIAEDILPSIEPSASWDAHFGFGTRDG